MRTLVTGGAGFIGHHLVRGLLERGHEVAVIDDFSTGRRSRLAPCLDRVALIEGSILDASALDEAIDGCDVVFHEAAIASVARSVADPRSVDEVNVDGTIDVVLAAARHGVRRVVYASSAAVYGIPDELPSRETLRPDPRSPYGAGKLAAEHYLHALGRLHGVETVVLRYFNVFGPGQDPATEYAAVVPRFTAAVVDGGIPVLNGSGEITRDFVHVENVVAANLLAASPTAPSGLTCNIASGVRTSLLELLDAICDVAGRRVEPTIGPAVPGDIPHSQADISLARHALGYEVSVGLQEGIARTVAWYREEGRPAAGERQPAASERQPASRRR